ncbi:hypothetical protein CFter6_2881 [Collimonas fungivorans]|uniref:Uncharacterized protein n=1 Tax=Collimonas fungivorans TaxID=158899 RepID=A0A127PCT0_9BURK|nr:hypothetical protein CFter6_2881 [Collimonas fungivorans]
MKVCSRWNWPLWVGIDLLRLAQNGQKRPLKNGIKYAI